jgi:hypothetical protein
VSKDDLARRVGELRDVQMDVGSFAVAAEGTPEQRSALAKLAENCSRCQTIYLATGSRFPTGWILFSFQDYKDKVFLLGILHPDGEVVMTTTSPIM